MLHLLFCEFFFPFSGKSRNRKDFLHIMGLMKKLFGDYSSRTLKSIYPIVDKIESLADEYKALSDAQLQAKRRSSASVLQTGKRWTICCRGIRHCVGGCGPRAGHASYRSSWWAASCFTRAASPNEDR
jgi:hypothetical protein